MTKTSLSVLCIALSVITGSAFADSQTVSVGYAQSRMEDFGHLYGVNMQYRYEWNSPLSVVGTFTYMTNEKKSSYYDEGASASSRAEVDQYSVHIGPAYRLNEFFSLYALLGITRTKFDATVRAHYEDVSIKETLSDRKTSFSYGGGIAINPIENLAVNLGYEGTRFTYDGDKVSTNGFNISVGYRF